jgi:hypothetical protein
MKRDQEKLFRKLESAVIEEMKLKSIQKRNCTRC